jgi:ketosteroid isomerase-like protein
MTTLEKTTHFNGESQMDLEENKRVARQLVEGLGVGDGTQAFDQLHHDAVWTVMADPAAFPVLGSMSRASFSSRIRAFLSALPTGIQITVTGITAEGNRVAVEAKSVAALPNGNVLNQVYHFLFEFRGGLVVSAREYIDTAHAVAQFRV